MIINLVTDTHLRGAVFEDGARILLRRELENNFIFCVKKFDSLIEIVDKYRLNYQSIKEEFSFFRVNPCLCDLVEFVLDNTSSRNIIKINFYDVKTRYFNSKRKYFDACISNHEFMKKMQSSGFGVFIASIILFDKWNFSFNIHNYESVFLKIHDSTTKKIVDYQRK
ncbi:MAG: hypothetical protein WC758_03915 [Candidatus Woesearchaeota archaeon]|jgi:hypothetical protein